MGERGSATAASRTDRAALPGHRTDIQILRALAVLLVLVYHGFEDALPLGFLGVDIFFAISGFLMTRMIVGGLDDGSFTLRAFYARRARRILPAAAATLLGTSVVASVLLASAQWRDYLWQLLGALTFTANVVLWDQGGYFDAEVETRPLLHFWSLAIEEQFYLLFPLAMLILPRNLRGPVVAAGILASIALYLFLNAHGHIAASFSLLPTRLWQLLAGAACALLTRRFGTLPLPAPLGAAIMLGIVLLAWRALPVFVAPYLAVLATCIVLAGRDGWSMSLAPVRWLSRIGDWSYSLYLVHWPLLAFANTVHAGRLPSWITAALLLAAFPLAWAQYRFVEQPFRHRRTGSVPRKGWILAGSGAALLAATGAAAFQTGRSAGQVPPPVIGLAEGCNTGWTDPDRPQCRTSANPRVAIWGDSFAMHLIPGILAGAPAELPLVQYTMPSCAPVVGIAGPGEAACMAFNQKVFDRIAASPNIRVVVLGSTWQLIGRDKPRRRLGADGKVRMLPNARTLDALADTVGALRRTGKQVYIVGPTAMPRRGDIDPPLCNLRQLEGRLLIGRSECRIALAEHRSVMPDVNTGLRQVADRTGARLFLPESVLCNGGWCATRSGRTLLYRDGNHLGAEGSRIVVGRLGIAQAIAADLRPGA
jgi:peptidoglycan/LPS O-acetylase OafA/YrhL